MARGQQKIQSQAKAQKKSEGKNKGHNLHEQKKAAAKALVHACPVCKVGAQPCSICVWKCVHTTCLHTLQFTFVCMQMHMYALCVCVCIITIIKVYVCVHAHTLFVSLCIK